MSTTTEPQRRRLTRERLKKKLEVSNFDLNAIFRGAQLTIVGALFTSKHYKQAVIAVIAGIAIRLALNIPIIGIKVLLWLLSFVVDLGTATWDDKVVDGLGFIQNYVLQVPFFLMTFMSYITPTLDNMFLDSLQWVDKTYFEKHKNEDPSTLRQPYTNLQLYLSREGRTHKSTTEAVTMFLVRYGKRAVRSLAIFTLSSLPIFGPFVLPAVSFYTFNQFAGLGPATIVFGTGIFLPRRYLVIFLQSYFSSRSLMRELLEPYFSRVKFTKEQKQHWFQERDGLLFGFGVGFFILSRIPFLGVFVYGIAEASTGYLVTKITDPPPRPEFSNGFAESQRRWVRKHEVLNLKLMQVDTETSSTGISSVTPSKPPRPYTEMRPR